MAEGTKIGLVPALLESQMLSRVVVFLNRMKGPSMCQKMGARLGGVVGSGKGSRSIGECFEEAK